MGGDTGNMTDLSPSAMMAGLSSAMHPTTYGGHSNNMAANSNDDLRFHGSELVMLYDYKVR